MAGDVAVEVNSPAARAERRRDRVDRLQVGAMFGAAGGVVVLLLVFAWGLLAQLGDAPPALGSLLLLHLGYVALYALAGAGFYVLWPLRRRLAGRFALHLLVYAPLALSAFSVAEGPFWTWSLATSGQALLAAVLFAVVFGWPERRRAPAGA